MSGRRAIYLTGRREIRERLRSRAFVVSTIVQLLVVLAIVVISALTSGDSTEKFDVGYVGSEPHQVVEALVRAEEALDAEITPHEYETVEAARTAVEDDEVDAAITPEGLIAPTDLSSTLLAAVQGVSAQVRSETKPPPPLPVEEVESGSAGGGIAFVGSLLLYIAILGSGFLVASAIVTEKSSRVIELVLSAIRPMQLLTGKVIGIGLLGLLQVLLTVGVGVAAAVAVGTLDLPASTAGAAILVLVYFVLGYLFYAAAFAVSGAIVSRQEDLQSTTAPISIVLIAAYLAGISTLESPDGGLATVCTFLPPVAPMVVPGRAAQGALPAWELVVSLALMVIGTALLILLATRIYERVVLRMGAPLKLRQALRIGTSRAAGG